MKKSNITKLLILSLSALCVFSSCVNNNSSSSEPSSSETQPSSSSTTSEIAKSKWGSKENPLTPDELYETMKDMGDDEWSPEKGYLRGEVKSVTYNSSYSNYELELVTSGSYVVKVYGAVLASGVSAPAEGDIITGHGLFKRYHSSSTGAVAYELAYNSTTKESPTIIKVEKGEQSNAPIEYEGSLEVPLTISQLRAKTSALQTSDYNTKYCSEKAAYVTGIAVDVQVSNSKYTIEIADENDNRYTIYSGKLDSGVKAPVKGDTVVAYGFYCNFNGVHELTYNRELTPTVSKTAHNDYDISYSVIGEDNEEDASLATVTVAETSTSGDTETLTITPAEGYKIARVSLNGATLSKVSGSYSFTTSHKNDIVIKIVDENTPTSQEYKIKYSGDTGNMDGSNQADLFGLDDEMFSVVGSKGSLRNNVGLNKSGEFRIYKGDPTDHKLTISVSEGHTIETVSLKMTSGYEQGLVVKVDGTKITPVNGVYTINASSFDIQNEYEQEQIRIKEIVLFAL